MLEIAMAIATMATVGLIWAAAYAIVHETLFNFLPDLLRSWKEAGERE